MSASNSGSSLTEDLLYNSDDDDDMLSCSSEGSEIDYAQFENEENEEHNSGEDEEWNWKKCDCISERKFPFLSQAGNQKTIRNILDSFLIFFDEDVVGKIVTETNRYAEQTMQSCSISSRIMRNWKSVDDAEIYVTLGVFMLMGIVRKPSIRSYYSKEAFIETPIFSRIMKKERYDLISRFLHFVDNSTEETFQGPKKLFKIYDFLELLKECFKSAYLLQRILASMNR